MIIQTLYVYAQYQLHKARVVKFNMKKSLARGYTYCYFVQTLVHNSVLVWNSRWAIQMHSLWWTSLYISLLVALNLIMMQKLVQTLSVRFLLQRDARKAMLDIFWWLSSGLMLSLIQAFGLFSRLIFELFWHSISIHPFHLTYLHYLQDRLWDSSLIILSNSPSSFNVNMIHIFSCPLYSINETGLEYPALKRVHSYISCVPSLKFQL